MTINQVFTPTGLGGDHPANGPLSVERLIRVRDELAAAAKRSDGGNLGYMMADAAKAIDEVLALRKAWQEPTEYLTHVVDDETGEFSDRMNFSLPVGTKLYAAPQLPQPAMPDIGEIRVGRLPTMNQDEYPGLGDWWVQLRIGDDYEEVLARVYGATPQEANSRAEALACRSAMLESLTTIKAASALTSPPKNEESPSTMLKGNHRDLSYPVDPQVDEYEKIMQQAVPDGWAAVPAEPTVEMRRAFHKANDECNSRFVSPDHQWQAMLEAVPKRE
ncbi:hypothetical protein [Leclercia sp.]|uniref:hypothetical protein n=1 Tax=Leclercia sp. TaxID=1898428 RepID=UPI002FDDC3FD